MSGVRSVKVAEGKRHEYVTQNGKVVRDQVADAATGAFQYMLDFTYDESGHPLTMRRYFNEAQSNYCTYHYILNAQGDVVKLMYGTNKTVAEYSYDAWGNLLNISGADLSVAKLNPLRYRGYYCDSETGFYYLQSRYYDPIVRRFLNADSYDSTGQGILGYNMFAYCNNNPVIFSDLSGHMMVCADRDLFGSGGGKEEPVPPPTQSIEEELFQALYRNTYGEYYYTLCGSITTVTVEKYDERTDLHVYLDVVALGAIFGHLGYVAGFGDADSTIFGGATGAAGNFITEGTHPEIIVFEVITYEATQGESGYNCCYKYRYVLDDQLTTITLIDRFYGERTNYTVGELQRRSSFLERPFVK